MTKGQKTITALLVGPRGIMITLKSRFVLCWMQIFVVSKRPLDDDSERRSLICTWKSSVRVERLVLLSPHNSFSSVFLQWRWTNPKTENKKIIYTCERYSRQFIISYWYSAQFLWKCSQKLEFRTRTTKQSAKTHYFSLLFFKAVFYWLSSQCLGWQNEL